MGGSGKSYYQYDASSMDPENLHQETTSSTVEQYTKYSREASRHQNTQQIREAAGNITTAGFRRGNFIRGDNTYINIYINI